MLILHITLDKQIAFSVYRKCSATQKYAKNAFSNGVQPRTPLGELTTLPKHPSRLGRRYPRPHPTPRLRRFDCRAFGARHLCRHPSLVLSAALELATACLQASERVGLAH